MHTRNKMIGNNIPEVKLYMRVRDDSIEGPNPYKWEHQLTTNIFKDKKIILFSLPGAYTPTCSTYQLPNFEKLYDDFQAEGVDEIYCMSVNDAFVMNAWAKSQGIEKVKVLPDGNAQFTRLMGMLVDKHNLGFGMRSWRYACLINNNVIEMWFQEPGLKDIADDDPYGETNPEYVLSKLKEFNEKEYPHIGELRTKGEKYI